MKLTSNRSSHVISNIWNKYKLFVERVTTASSSFKEEDISYWQQSIFTRIILYALPVGAVIAIPSAIIVYFQGQNVVTVVDLLTVISIALVSLNKRIPLQFRKAFIVVMLYLLAIVSMLFLGSFGIGSIYLLGLSVFITLQFSKRVSYSAIMVNFIIYTCFALIIHFKLFNSPLISTYEVSFWISNMLSFMFLNIAVILQIRHVVNGLKKVLAQKAVLLNQLQSQYEEKLSLNVTLKESESHYKSLFSHSPSPMWIYDAHSFQFLQVNDTAIRNYGYLQEEFLTMTVKDIRAVADDKETDNQPEDDLEVSTTQHRNKCGHVFTVEVRCRNMMFKGKDARLVIAIDITEQVEHTRAIESQNKKLEEIAFMQSHVVRAPLARIIGLNSLIMQDSHLPVDPQLISYLDQSVKELDDVVKAIVGHSQEILPVSAAKNKTNP